MVGLDASHGSLQPSIVALAGVKKISDSTVIVWELLRNMLGSSLHRHKSVSVLSNKPLEGKVGLAFPQSSVEELLVTLDLSLFRTLCCYLLEHKSLHTSDVNLLKVLKGVSNSWCCNSWCSANAVFAIYIQRIGWGRSRAQRAQKIHHPSFLCRTRIAALMVAII